MVVRLEPESRVLAEMAGLAGHEYHDVVRAILDMVEHVVSTAMLALAVREIAQVGHYVRVTNEAEPTWAHEVEWHLREVQRQRLSQAPFSEGASRHHLAAPAAWFVSFNAAVRETRGTLTLASSQPFVLALEDERRLGHVMQQALLVLDHALLTQQLENLEVTDQLTGVANHRRLLETLDYELHRHRYWRRELSLLLLDVEGLARINQSYGCHYGNHILSRLAALVQEAARPVDLVARCGLDEFALVLPETDEETARQIAEELRERILSMRFAGGGIGISVGIVHAKPDGSLSPDNLLRRAEQTLHQVKRHDREWDVPRRGRM